MNAAEDGTPSTYTVRVTQGEERKDSMPVEGWRLAAVDVTVGRHFSCALLSNGEVKCWGNNRYGQLGLGEDVFAVELDGSTVPTSVALGRGAIDIDAGDEHVCAVLDDGSVRCWGRNQAGQLGQGHMEDDLGPAGDDDAVVLLSGKALRVGLGDSHSCALIERSDVPGRLGLQCWGSGPVALNGLGSQSSDMPPEEIISLGGATVEQNADDELFSTKGFTLCVVSLGMPFESGGPYRCRGWNRSPEGTEPGVKPFVALNRTVGFDPRAPHVSVFVGIGYVCHPGPLQVRGRKVGGE